VAAVKIIGLVDLVSGNKSLCWPPAEALQVSTLRNSPAAPARISQTSGDHPLSKRIRAVTI